MGSISSLGVGSGLDLNSLIDGLIRAEALPPTQRLDRREADLQLKISSYGLLKNALSEFRSAILSLANPDTFDRRSATSSNESAFTATANSDAIAGEYAISVNSLAQSHKLISGDADAPANQIADIGGGTLTIAVGGNSFDLVIADDESSLNEIRDAINSAADNTGVKAEVINGDLGSKLVLTGDNVGSANAITVSVTDNDGVDDDTTGLSYLASINLDQQRAASDAEILVNNQLVTNTSGNTFEDVIEGVTITAKEVTTQEENLSVAVSTSSAQGAIAQFVAAFSTLQQTFDQLGVFNEETGQKGALLGDALLRQIEQGVNEIVRGEVPGQPTGFSFLSQVGVQFDDKGLLTIEIDDQNAALDENLSAVAALFTDETNGIAARLEAFVTGFTAFDGILTSKTNSLNQQVDKLGDDREALNLRLQALEKRLIAKFSAMDALVAQLNSTGSFLSQQLANINNIVNRSNSSNNR